MTTTANLRIAKSRQHGAALFVSLITLMVLTLIAVTGASSSALEMLIATNTQNAAQALALAEDAAFAAETDILTNHNGGAGPAFDFDEIDADGYYSLNGIDLSNVSWDNIGHEQLLDGNGNVIGQYAIEYLGTIANSGGSLGVGAGSAGLQRFAFRITARGSSSRGTTRLVQTIFATN